MIQRHQQLTRVRILSILFFSYSISVSAQNLSQISLDSCIELAIRNYPLQNHKQYVQSMSNNAVKQINAGMLPQISLASKATYQSEISEIDIPGFPSLTAPKDNYSFGLQLNQTVYDFGKLSQSKAIERARATTDLQKNEVDMYAVRSVIVQLYSNILLTQANIKILDSYSKNIQNRYADMQSGVANGVVLQSNLDILYAEKQKTNQRMIEARSALLTLEQTLAMHTQANIDTATTFIPIIQSELYAVHDSVKRPELMLFDSQLQLIDEKLLLEKRNKMPRLYMYGEGAYGRPGYNFLNHDMRFFGIAGLGLSWNLNNLYTNSITSQNLIISKNIVEEQRSLFEIKQNSELIKQQNDINKLKLLIETDMTILEKRESITATAADQLENGIITSTDYLTELFAQKQAELNEQIHEIQLQLAVVNYNLTVGTN